MDRHQKERREEGKDPESEPQPPPGEGQFQHSMSSVKPLLWFGAILLLVVIYGVLSAR